MLGQLADGYWIWLACVIRLIRSVAGEPSWYITPPPSGEVSHDSELHLLPSLSLAPVGSKSEPRHGWNRLRPLR